MTLYLRSGLAYALHGDDVILMDIDHDRYFALPRRMRDAFARVVDAGSPQDADLQNLAPLVDQQLLQSVKARKTYSRGTYQHASASLPATYAPITAGLYVQAVYCRLRAAAWLHVLPLRAIVARLECSKARATHAGRCQNDAARIAAAFNRVGNMIPMKDRCLPASLGLVTMLHHHSIPATLVIAVRTAPFASHCWVETDNHLVNEQFETISGFSPILVV
jgi:hypothetical protein